MILGVDPGIRNCGWAVIEPPNRVLRCGCWTTEPGVPLAERAARLVAEATRELGGVSLLSLEGWDGRAGHRSAAASTTPRVIGELVATARALGVQAVELPTQLIKELAGLDPAAEKRDVRRAVIAACAGEPPPNMAKHQHAFDAILAAMAGARWRNERCIG